MYFSVNDWAYAAFDAERFALKIAKKAEETKNEKVAERVKGYREEADIRWKDFWSGDTEWIKKSKKLVAAGGSFNDLMKLVDERDGAHL